MGTSSREGALRLMRGFQLVGGVQEEVGTSCRLTRHGVGDRRTHTDNGTLLVWENPKEVSGMLQKMGGNEAVLLASFKAVLAHSLLNLHG